MDLSEELELVRAETRAVEMHRVTTYDGAGLRIEVHQDATAYFVVAEDDAGGRTVGNSYETLRGALHAVHWDELTYQKSQVHYKDPEKRRQAARESMRGKRESPDVAAEERRCRD